MPRLDQRRVDALEPRTSVRHVRDSELEGFGVRTLPSGRKTCVLHTQHQGKRAWKPLGHVHAMTESEARSRAVAVLASIRSDHRARRMDIPMSGSAGDGREGKRHPVTGSDAG